MIQTHEYRARPSLAKANWRQEKRYVRIWKAQGPKLTVNKLCDRRANTVYAGGNSGESGLHTSERFLFGTE